MSREFILDSIRKNKPQAIPLPELPAYETKTFSLKDSFSNVLRSIGGSCREISAIDQINSFIDNHKNEKIVNGIASSAGYNLHQYANSSAEELDDVQWAIIEGAIAVAENGAIWLPEKNMVNRLLPFICQHLVLVIQEHNLVATMHQAYERIRIDQEGYGVFIAGPSKTADIEQSLVVGAHGPVEMQAWIVS